MFDTEDTAVLVLAALLTRADPAGHTGTHGWWWWGVGGSPRPHPPSSEHKSTCLNPPSSCRSPSSPCAQLRAEAAVDRGGLDVELRRPALQCPPLPSSFTVTSLERNRSKQTCGGREFPRMMDHCNQGSDGALPLVEAALESLAPGGTMTGV